MKKTFQLKKGYIYKEYCSNFIIPASEDNYYKRVVFVVTDLESGGVFRADTLESKKKWGENWLPKKYILHFNYYLWRF